MAEFRIFLLEDDSEYADSIAASLRRDRSNTYALEHASSLEEAKDASLDEIDLCLVDLCLSDTDPRNKDGLDFIKHLSEIGAEIPIIVLSQYAAADLPETIIRSFRLGIADYYQKARLRIAHLSTIIQKALEKYTLGREITRLRSQVKSFIPHKIIGNSPRIRNILDSISEYGRILNDGSSVTVLITGETGTGKELVASAIHFCGERHDKPFVPVNIKAIPESLVEAELFGVEAGAYTGAVRSKKGYFESAGDGTLFIDEIAEISLDVQVKLLRVLQERKFNRLGSTKSIDLSAQLICATHRDLENMIEEGRFREDLYYRINVVNIRVPALRERRDDIPLLAVHFLNKMRRIGQTKIREIPQPIIDILKSYDWPGNVRELQNAIESMVVNAAIARADKLSEEFLPPRISKRSEKIPNGFNLKRYLAEQEQRYINLALQQSENQDQAAALIGLKDRFALARRKRIIKNLLQN